MDFLNLYNFPPLISSLLFISLGFFVFFKNKKSAVNFVFFLVCLATFWWQFSWFLLFSTNNESFATILIKIGYMGIAFIPATFFNFFVLFLGEKNKVDKFLTYFSYIFSSFFIFLLFFTNYFVDGFYKFDWGFYPKAGFMHPIYLLFLFSLAIRILYLSFGDLKKEKEANTYKFYQLKYVLIALFFYIFSAMDFIVNYGINFYPLGFLFILLFLITFAYTIIRHRLMDIKLAMKNSFVFLMPVLVMAVSSCLILYYAEKFFGWPMMHITLGLIIFWLFFFPFVKKYYYGVANKYFFSSLYDGAKVVGSFSSSLTTALDVLDLEKIYQLIFEAIDKSMHPKAFAFLNYDSASHQYFLKFSRGFSLGNRIVFPSELALHQDFIVNFKPIIVEEIRATAYEEHKEILDLLIALKVAVIVPLNIQDENLGIIALGHKESGDMYNDEDLRTLLFISSQVAAVIKNAQLLSETKGFSLTLQREVERQTKELKQANEDLTKLDKAKSDFISIASHQLRTPLTAIKGFTSMILEGSYGRTTKVVHDKLEKIYESAERLIRLVNDLLDLSHMEGGKMEFNFQKINLTQMVKSVSEELDIQAQKKKLKLTVNLPDQDLFVKADEQKLRQVVMNLIDNAIKYTEKGKAEVSLKESDNKVQFSVKDTGMGMKPEEITNLFQKFVRGSEASHYHTEGAGIGLYVARQLVEAHMGRVWAESEGEGKGSTFLVELPEWGE